MLIRKNKREIVGKMNTTITLEGAVIKTNTIYYDGRSVIQNITIRDNEGKVRTTNVIGGKLFP